MVNKDDFETVEVEEITSSTNGLQTYQQDKALIDMQIATAKKYPRNLKRCIENAITMVTLDKDIAESCTYSLKKGGKLITGPSIYLAKILLQQFGNMRAENRVVGYDSTHVTCVAVCFDLERNFAMRTEIKKSIVGREGRYTEDMCVITGNAGNSIALRNAVFAVIDQSVITKVYDAAKQKITGDVSDDNKLVARRTALFEGFKQTYESLKLTDEEIAGAVNKDNINHITKEDLVILIGFEKSMREGEMKPLELFRPQKGSVRPVPPPDKSAERILALIAASKDVKSLEKLLSACTSPESKTAYDNQFKKLKNES